MRVIYEGLAYVSLTVLAMVNAAATQVGVPITVVPMVNLAAIIGAAITVGMGIQRFRDLERRVTKLEGDNGPD